MIRATLCACVLTIVVGVNARAADKPASQSQASNTIDELLNRPKADVHKGVVTPKNTAKAPEVSIHYEQPKNLLFIDFSSVGGALRDAEGDWIVEFKPPIDANDIVYESGDKTKMRIAADPGTYELEILAVGQASGVFRKKEKFTVKDMRKAQSSPAPVVSPVPLAPTAQQPASRVFGYDDPIEFVKSEAAAVPSKNRIAESHAIAAALQNCESWAECLKPAKEAIVRAGGNPSQWRRFIQSMNEMLFDLRDAGVLGGDSEFTEARAVRNIARVLQTQ